MPALSSTFAQLLADAANNPDWLQVNIGPVAVSDGTPPSLKRPRRVKVVNPDDGLRSDSSKAERARAFQDLRELHKRLLRQTGRVAMGTTNYLPMPDPARSM